MNLKAEVLLLTLLSLAQCPVHASAMSALRTWWHRKSAQQELNEQLQRATLEVYANKVKDNLDGMQNAIQQANVPSFEQHTRQLLESVKQNPDILWHASTKWDGSKILKLIDAVSPFECLHRRLFLHRIIPVPVLGPLYEDFRRSMEETYRTCLLLSKRSILEPFAGQSYLAQLVRDVEAKNDIIIGNSPIQEEEQKLQLALEYLADAYRHTLYTNAAQDIIPNVLNSLITTDFLHGVRPELQKNFAKEAAQLEMRRHSSKKNEFDFFLNNSIIRFALRGNESHLHNHNNRLYHLLRGFAHAGLTTGNLTTKAHRSLLPTTIPLYIANRLRAVTTAGTRMMRDIVIMSLVHSLLTARFYEYNGQMYTYLPDSQTILKRDHFAGGMLFGSLFMLGIHKWANFLHKKLNTGLAQETLYRPFSKRWKKVIQGVNNARLDFERDSYRPNIIPAPSLVAQENNLGLE